jgi:hypothetical protein
MWGDVGCRALSLLVLSTRRGRDTVFELCRIRKDLRGGPWSVDGSTYQVPCQKCPGIQRSKIDVSRKRVRLVAVNDQRTGGISGSDRFKSSDKLLEVHEHCRANFIIGRTVTDSSRQTWFSVRGIWQERLTMIRVIRAQFDRHYLVDERRMN